MKRITKILSVGLLSTSLLAACGQSETNTEETKAVAENLSLEEITQKAKEEGEVASVAMPDSWANWGETWKELESEYSLKHKDTDMSSAEELSKFESEGKNATADIGDVGINFGPLAKDKGLTLPYKTSYWDDVPEWAKDDEGHWVLGYTGTIAFLTDKNNVKNPPKTWDDILNGDYKVAIGDVTKGTQSQFAVLAAAMSKGGDEKNIESGLEYFAQIAKQGRLSSIDSSIANLEKGEVDVAVVWDFNGLNYRDQIDKNRFEVTIPEDTSVVSGYTTVINKNAKHPHAAMLAREYILSDEGQINLARGYARPIRDNVKLPADVQEKVLPKDQYKNAKPVEDFKAWDETAKQIPQLWQEKVLIHVK
ncbi:MULTISPECIES: ABC transporter substrate-binding protein [Bacillus]|uniref:ABC transporter substrate-binding protein n=2 Tax=Bacillus TaxID=1386 RepID=A0A0M4FEE1_9BACI|nr:MULTISPECIES: extracellular solute-binding protein [Bacillus]ALC80537.1 ABC transporter substrate-binding protein [Bacillus gobiensis]MBP1083615.1 putative spermidine/putrescine transport system substrate-binding protein [Bacillus capparidis]MED1094808.1 extracellular solute-binding protein [Bacillus capparidis]